MGLKDLLIFPIMVLIVFAIFHIWQVKSGNTGKRWKVAFFFKIFSTLFIGLLYEYYYKGGDTFNFFHHSKQIWLATLDHPISGIKMLFNHGVFYPELSDYIVQMWWFKDESSMMVARISAFFGFFCGHSYLGISIFFALISFLASMSIYRVFKHIKPELDLEIFIICFFIPSVGVWGSGLFKDTISFAAACFIIYGFYFGFIRRNKIVSNVILIIVSSYFLYIIKIYILISLLPALLIWVFIVNLSDIKSLAIKAIMAPLFVAIAGLAGFTIISQITSENERYALSNISNTAKITAMDIYAGWGAGSGSAYYLGAQDGSIGNFVSLMPSAIVVTLFRPWPWEINNVIMVMSALESFFFLVFTLFVVFKTKLRNFVRSILSNPEIIFCLTFSIVLAIGVGIASYNFGTLSRYKIPLMPFYLLALLFIYRDYQRIRKRA